MAGVMKKAAADAALEGSDIKDSDSKEENVSDIHVEDVEKDRASV